MPAKLQRLENKLAAQRILAQEAQQRVAVVHAAEASLRLTQNQYKAGTAPYFNTLTAQSPSPALATLSSPCPTAGMPRG